MSETPKHSPLPDCVCRTWCSDNRPPFTQHHRHCFKYDLEKESVAVVAALIKAIEAWAADEDGVHADAWDAYRDAICFVGDFTKLSKLAAKEEAAERMFPIQASHDLPATQIPWAMIAPHEMQAFKNHSQSLQRLAERCGLSRCEALAVLEDRRWNRMWKWEVEAQFEAALEAYTGKEAKK